MPTYRLTLEYDGTDFEGWQLQPAPRRTVQGCLADALAQIAGAPVRVRGAGRTDSGVHALGQVASAQLDDTRLDEKELLRALNATLPSDIAVRSLVEVDPDFDPRRGARTKLYRYVIWNHPLRSPLRARTSVWVRWPLDVAAMQEAAEAFVGTHDFASFQAAGSDVVSTVRTLERLSIEAFHSAPSATSAPVEGRSAGGDASASGHSGELVLEFEGTGFLRYMVRNIAGTLLEIGRGHRARDEIPEILAAKDRSRAGRTAPAHGLTLVCVRYADEAPAGAG